MNDTGPDIAGQQIDDDAVQQYFEGITTDAAASASYMAHAQNLPPDSVRYRLRGEVATITDWLAEMPADGKVLDLGCGAGTWTEIFARRCGTAIGVERSASMVRCARARLAGQAHVEIQQRDARARLPEGPFDLIFLGGLCMYLNDADVIALLRTLRAKLETGGSVILRESTIPRGSTASQGEYQAVYRSVPLYRNLFQAAGFFSPDVRRNRAYTAMEVAVELVELRRRTLPFLPAESPALGALTWWALRCAAPVTFRLVPWLVSAIGLNWPRLQNHFFRLRL